MIDKEIPANEQMTPEGWEHLAKAIFIQVKNQSSGLSNLLQLKLSDDAESAWSTVAYSLLTPTAYAFVEACNNQSASVTFYLQRKARNLISYNQDVEASSLDSITELGAVQLEFNSDSEYVLFNSDSLLKRNNDEIKQLIHHLYYETPDTDLLPRELSLIADLRETWYSFTTNARTIVYKYFCEDMKLDNKGWDKIVVGRVKLAIKKAYLRNIG